MTYRELFNNIMHYGEFDRMPVVHWFVMKETLRRWHDEGLSETVSDTEFPGTDHLCAGVGVNIGLYPPFEEEVLEEDKESRVIRQGDGVIARHWKNHSGVPNSISYTLTSKKGWDEYRRRLQPDPARIPKDLDRRIADAESPGLPVSVPTGSLIGGIRNWMGVEELAYLCYDNRDLLKEMVTTITDLVIWGLRQTLPKVKVDLGWGWEDICFRTGPLISPLIFEEVAVPAYRRIAYTLLEYGVDLYLVDCDGMIDHLLPLWLEGGVNVMFPMEIGPWHPDPMAYRKQYGRELRMFGGIDKRELAKGRDAIDAEIARRLPLMKDGGYIPLPDHRIIPTTSLSDYQYYLEQIRELRF